MSKGVWVWIRRLKEHPALITTNLTQRRTHVCSCPGCWRLINMSYDKKQNCWQTTKGITHDQLYHAEESKAACAVVEHKKVQERKKINVMLSSYAGPAQMVLCIRDLAGLGPGSHQGPGGQQDAAYLEVSGGFYGYRQDYPRASPPRGRTPALRQQNGGEVGGLLLAH